MRGRDDDGSFPLGSCGCSFGQNGVGRELGEEVCWGMSAYDGGRHYGSLICQGAADDKTIAREARRGRAPPLRIT